MTTHPADRQAVAARAVIAHIAERLKADLSVQLWDGSIVPLGPDARDDIRLVMASPKAIRRMLLKPGLMTLFELYGVGELTITGGTPLEAAKRWDHITALSLPKTVDKWFLFKQALPFLRGGSKVALVLREYP